MEHTISISAERFLNLIRTSRLGKLKIYIGMAAGVGKTYRMILEAKELLNNKVDVLAGYIETHGRKDIEKLLEGLPVIGRKQVFYKGKQLEEMDIDAVLLQKPEVVLVDELAHTNVPGSKNEKRWQDVKELIDAGINVISTVNIQHIESINAQVEKITGIKITERVPDTVIYSADEVVNVDLTIEELIDRLKEGKIYDLNKVPTALANFFRKDKLLQLRDLAIKEVSRQVERKILNEIPLQERTKVNAIITAISTNHRSALNLIRKSSRLVSTYNSRWYVVYVKTKRESVQNINSAEQRHLIDIFKLAVELGAEVVELENENVPRALIEFAVMKEAGLLVIGKPEFNFFNWIHTRKIFKQLIEGKSGIHADILWVCSDESKN
jgi:two-component system sensor histidine kinase KdpD